MRYAGLTHVDVQNYMDAYFHSANIQQMTTNIQSKSCGTSSPISKRPPVITVGAISVAIPKSTRFYLDAAGTTDPDGDDLTFCWEQNGNATFPVDEVKPTQLSGPIFRSFYPTSSTRRYFPDLNSDFNFPST